MAVLTASRVPAALKQLPQWVAWKTIERGGKATKMPYQVSGVEAKSNDPGTWTDFETALEAAGQYDGIGFVFAQNGGLVGIDLDGCRNPETGEVAPWAKEIILRFETYAEISPTQTGVKLYCLGKSPFDGGKKRSLSEPKVSDKEPGIEIYDKLRYFAVTGHRLVGPPEPTPCQPHLDWFKEKFWPDVQSSDGKEWYGDDAVVERARKYLAKLPPAISGQGGHNAAFHVACMLILGFGLTRETSLVLMREWNQTCQPPWSDRELEHKVDSANQQQGPRNYLRTVRPDKWDTVKLPKYEAPPFVPEPLSTTLVQAAGAYLERLQNGKCELLSLGISAVDDALGGGVEYGEMVVVASRPSHGKSALALQCAHCWTALGIPTLIVAEEMSPLAYGKRTLQFISEVYQEHWRSEIPKLKSELAEYAEGHGPAYLLECCRKASTAAEQMGRFVREKAVQAVVVDYAQLLAGKGKSRYEEITDVSVKLRQATSENKTVTLVLCQMSRSIEHRKTFTPTAADLKDTGQFEQDADVILFLVWPHRIDSKKDPHEYQIFVAKNRNRPIVSPVVKCRFEPGRQMVLTETPETYSEFDPFSGEND